MKHWLMAVALVCLGGVAFASPYVGKLDLGHSDPQAIAVRELHDGMWIVGAQQQVWHLQNTVSGNEVFHVSAFWATRLEGQDTAYGPSIGINIGEAAHAALLKVEALAPVLAVNPPPWLSKISSWVSFDVYGGYRPFTHESSDVHVWIYGVGGKVTIPLSALYAWAKGSWVGGGPGETKGL